MNKKPDSQHNYPRVEQIRSLRSTGPWSTKSQGELTVLSSLPWPDLQEFLAYDTTELSKIPHDIRGLREYKVTGLPIDSMGANEWHKVRNELVFCLRGRLRWTFKDLYGTEKTIDQDQGMGLWTPPWVLHTYRALEHDTEILVVANTLFIVDEPSTHDTYTAQKFIELQNARQQT